MTNMENLDAKLAESDRQARVYEVAMKKLAAKKAAREQQGAQVIATMISFGGEPGGDSFVNKTSKLAAMFVIGFAFLVPSLLLIRYVL